MGQNALSASGTPAVTTCLPGRVQLRVGAFTVTRHAVAYVSLVLPWKRLFVVHMRGARES